MRPTVLVTLRKQQWEVPPGQTAREIMLGLGLEPDRYLIIRNGQVVSEDVRLEAGDRLKLAAIIAGGSHERYSCGASVAKSGPRSISQG